VAPLIGQLKGVTEVGTGQAVFQKESGLKKREEKTICPPRKKTSNNLKGGAGAGLRDFTRNEHESWEEAPNRGGRRRFDWGLARGRLNCE